MSDILRKVSGLLNKAENTDNEHEREAFYQAAQAMATRYEIDLEAARQRTLDKQSDNKIQKRSFPIGTKGDRGAGAYADLFVTIADVQGLYYYYTNAEVTAYGLPSDLDYVEALYAVIVQQMVRECKEYIDSDEWRVPGNKGIHDARRSFYQAYRDGIRRRLKEARDQAIREADREMAEGTKSASLMLADKNREIRSMYWNDTSGMRFTRRASSGSNSTAKGAGRSAASRARINRSEGIGGVAGALE